MYVLCEEHISGVKFTVYKFGYPSVGFKGLYFFLWGWELELSLELKMEFWN